MLINSENLFLIVLGIIWIFGAVLQDLKRREVDNLWNFSLIAFALAYRALASIFNGDYWFFLNGLIGLGIFLILGNLFYYSRLFAGGDAKLLIGLGGILPLSYNWLVNLEIFGIFILLFLVTGAVYVLVWAIFLAIKNSEKFKKEWAKQWKIYRKMFLIFFIVSFLFIIFIAIISQLMLAFIGIIILLFPILFIFAKSVEESCMVFSINPKKLTEGEWLYRDIVVNGKKIKSRWDGVSGKELELIKKRYKKDVLIKKGVPFTPSFLMGFILLLFLFWRYRMWF